MKDVKVHIKVKKEYWLNKMTSMPIWAQCTLLLLILSTILYGRYLFGDKYFIFPTAIMDGETQFYTRYVEIARMFSEKHRLIDFSFYTALGDMIGNANPFDILVVVFGVKHVAYMMGVVIIVKIILSGTFFGAYLNEYGMERNTCIIFSILYGFSFQVVGAGCWKTQGELAVIMAFSLWVIERYLNKRKIGGIFGILIGFLFILDTYYQILYGICLVAYSAYRYFEKNGTMNQTSSKSKMKKTFWIYLFLVGLILMFLVFYPKVQSVFMSSRVTDGIKNVGEVWKDTFSKSNLKDIVYSFFRTLSPNILGIPLEDSYMGKLGYMRDGCLYCGLLCVLLIPQVIEEGCKKKKAVYYFLLCLVIIYVLCPGIRYISNAFVYTSYRDSRMWTTLILIYVAANEYNQIITGKQKINFKVLSLTYLLCVVPIVLFWYFKWREQIVGTNMLLLICLLSLYVTGIVLLTIDISKSRKVIKYFVIIVIVEVIGLNTEFVNNKDAVNKEEWNNSSNIYYNDGTGDVVNYLDNNEQNFYRLNKSYNTIWYADSEAQNYRGTAFYRGGTIGVDLEKYIVDMGIPTHSNMTGYLTGTYGMNELSSLLSVKYLLTNNSNITQYGYNYLTSISGIDVF